MKSRLFLTVLVGWLGFSAPLNAEAKLTVVATTSMITDLVRSIGGERVDVHGLMGPGVDPHLYKPTAGDVARLQKAKIVFYNGLMLEGQMGELLGRLAKTRKVVALGEALPKDRLLNPDGSAGHPDPHIWGDAELWSLCVDAVTKELAEADPAGASIYATAANSYRTSLLETHAWARRRCETIPKEHRVLITSHDAFNYLGRAYGFEVVGVQGISTAAEAGLADVVHVIDLVKQRRVKAVFVESSVSRSTIDRISADSGARIGGELFSDAVGTRGKLHHVDGESYDEGTVIGMLKHNINTIVEALK